MKIFSKFNGVPNSHFMIICSYLSLILLAAGSVFAYAVQSLINGPILNLDIHIISPKFWILFIILAVMLSVIIITTNVTFQCLGYRQKYQKPLHNIIREFYKKGTSSSVHDSTGKVYTLTDNELSDCNRAIRRAYLKPIKSGLLLIFPCTIWGFIGIGNKIIDNLRDGQGNLNSIQQTINEYFPDYRFQANHYEFKDHKVIWHLIAK